MTSYHTRILWGIAFLWLIICSLPTLSRDNNLKEIYIVPLIGHLDVGFTATQREVKLKWQSIYREGIELLERVPEAKLTSDSLLPIEWFKESASDDEWSRFKKLVHSGRWELTAGWAHLNTTVISEAQSHRYFLYARKWEEELQARIKVWHHADVPGLAWNMAESATDAGLELIVVGANELGGLTPLPPLPRLFNWEAPDGDKITVSLHGGSGYLEGGLDLKLHVADGLEERLQNFGFRLHKQGYPLDFALVLFSSGDNRGPAILEQLLNTVKEWNNKGKTPSLRIATFSEFNDRLKSFHSSLPTIRADFPASWETLIMRAPRGEKAVREAKLNLKIAEILSIINGTSAKPKIALAWQNVLLHDEHAGVGAWEGSLTREQLHEQNLTEYRYAFNALQASRELLSEQLSSLARSSLGNNTNTILLFNHTTTRKNLVRIGDDYSYSVAPSSQTISTTPTRLTRLKKFNSAPYHWRFISPAELGDTFSYETKSLRIPPCNMLTISQLFLRAQTEASEGKRIALLEQYQNCEVNAYMRGGVWIDTSLLAYSGTPKMFFAQEGALLNCGNSISLLAEARDGAPLFLLDGHPAFVLYQQEAPAKFRDGTMGYVAQEPTADETIAHDIFVMETHRPSQKEAYLKLHEFANPMRGIEVCHAGRFKERVNYLRTDDPRAVIVNLWQAGFGEGIVVAIRNISGERVTASLRTDYWDIKEATRVDLLERAVSDEGLFCSDVGNRGTECRGTSLKPYVTLKPFSVVYVKLVIDKRH